MPAGRDQITPMQRLVRIMAVLDQNGSVGASRDQLIEIAGYGVGDPGTQLGQDLKHLRNQGWQIDNIARAGETARYRMVPGDNRLRLKLTASQLAALQRAVMLVDRADLSKSLGVHETELPAGFGTNLVPRAAGGSLSLALEAVSLRSRISFTYKGSGRTVDTGAVRFQNYQWYLSGVEVGDELVKHFAVNRMSAPVLDKPGTAAGAPQVGPIPLHPLLWQVDEPTTVVLRTPADYVPDVERWLQVPDDAVPGEGWVQLRYTVTNRAAFRARIYVLGTRVRVVGPAEFRDEVLAELRTMVGR